MWNTVAGSIMTIGGEYNYREGVSVWFRSFLAFHPDASLMADAPLGFQLHALVAFGLFALWPFTRLVHVFSAPAGLPDPSLHRLPQPRRRPAGQPPTPPRLGPRGLSGSLQRRHLAGLSAPGSLYGVTTWIWDGTLTGTPGSAPWACRIDRQARRMSARRSWWSTAEICRLRRRARLSPSRSWATKTAGVRPRGPERRERARCCRRRSSRPRRATGRASSASPTARSMLLSRPSVSVTSTTVRLGASSRKVARNPTSRSSSPRKVALLRVTSTPPGSAPDHCVTRYAAVAPAARLSTPT